MKSQVIEQILPLLRLVTPAERSKMRLELQARTLAELKAFLDVVSSRKYQAELAELADEAILKIQAERAADFAIFQMERQRQTAPQRTREAAKQLELDGEVFQAVCRKHLIANIEANFSLLRSALGDDFTEYSATRAITSGAVQLAKANQSEQDRYRQEAVEAQNEALQKMDHDQLRAQVRKEATDSRAANAKAEADSQLAAAQARDSHFHFPSLPDEITSARIKEATPDQIKFWIKKYGSAQLNLILRK
jgi:hypothetical protein